jgi:hypothetical protein
MRGFSIECYLGMMVRASAILISRIVEWWMQSGQLLGEIGADVSAQLTSRHFRSRDELSRDNYTRRSTTTFSSDAFNDQHYIQG